ncbi:MAG: asparagine synthase (glutamine-hydrolyzing), partial [Syntrophaceae bacterium]|nr:asparagine synthase (glutamine-hydrolyzing) [Syntrophaceae bacterium]
MCGIAGFINAPGSHEQQRGWLQSMTDALYKRGPDGSGLRINDAVALGHRRLSIIDLETGSQPMCSYDGSATIVFNGEIYNFPEIRAELAKIGVPFKTRSDTEVLLCSYLIWGPECLDKFEGMFAFAIWDSRTNSLFAARDRMGKKPFYYTFQDGVFAFASELTAFRRLPFLSLRIEREQIARFLAYEYVPTPYTIFRDVYKLKPGHSLTFCADNITISQFWDLPVPHDTAPCSETEACEHTVKLLKDAVRKRLISDVPLGVFLSGGIDSSAVVALMAEEVDPRTIKTFSIGFTEASYDESKYARLVASHFGTDHHEQILSAMEAGALLPSIVSMQDEPMSDPSIVPTYLLSQITRRDVTVALGGDGGDELFAGYEYYSAFILSNYYLKLPEFLRKKIVEPFCRRL